MTEHITYLLSSLQSEGPDVLVSLVIIIGAVAMFFGSAVLWVFIAGVRYLSKMHKSQQAMNLKLELTAQKVEGIEEEQQKQGAKIDKMYERFDSDMVESIVMKIRAMTPK